MFPPLTEKCMDRWLADFDEFRVEFLRVCTSLCHSVGYSFEFDQEKLSVAHEAWKATVDMWIASYVMPNSNGLSHLKIMSILLEKLASVDWVREIYEFDTESNRDFEYNGSKEELDETRKDIAAGRGTFLAFQFCILIINWFEIARIDRAKPFEFRLTHDLQHDIMVYLSSEKRDDMALFLIMKALYAAHAK